MTLTADEFMRRLLLHVLLTGFHRIRQFGLIAKLAEELMVVHYWKFFGQA